jgi:ankyrin repeat protein
MGRTALITAAAQRDSYRIVKYLMEKGADPNARDQAGDFLTAGNNGTALMFAVKSGDNRTVKLLLDRGVDVNAAASTGGTALGDAISARNAEAVRMLLDRGARVNLAFGPIRMTPLIWASFQEYPEVVEMLLAAGADVNAKDALGSTALIWAAMSERDDTATVSALLRAGAGLDVKTAMGETPMSWAKRRGNTGIVRLFESEMKQQGGSNEKQ